jgi:dolichyl-phosphate-mannose--protein O-mannosyl transferase
VARSGERQNGERSTGEDPPDNEIAVDARSEEAASQTGETPTQAAAGDPESEEATAAVVAPVSRRWTRAEIIVLVLLTLVAGGLRLWNLADPDTLVFDETYYAKDACWYAFSSESVCTIADEQTKVHPPLGKWMISAGVKAFGNEALGWRIVPALAGIVSVPLLFALSRRLFRSLIAASLAAGLLAIDFLHLVQSRMSMLDIFVMFFGLAAFLCLVIDRDRLLEGSVRHGRALARPWRAAAGALGGAATASKWSGLFVIAAVFVLSLIWEAAARRERKVRDEDEARSVGFFKRLWTGLVERTVALFRAIVGEWSSLLLYLVLLPVLVYLVTYLGRLDGEPFFSLPWSEGSWGRALWARHAYMLDFHANLKASHPYQSPGWSWILLKRPVSYFFCGGNACNPPDEPGRYQEIFASGSPFVWWSTLLAMAWLAVAWLRRRDFRRPEGLILGALIFTYGPWLVPFTDRSAVFLFYLLPVVPFMCLAVAYAAWRIGWRSWEAKSAIALYSAIALGFFVFYFPLLTKVSITESSWRARIWIFDNCDKPPGDPTTSYITGTDAEGNPSYTETEVSTTEDHPPTGWCWI